MNPIGQSLLPIAATRNTPGGSEPACTQAPEGEGSFDSLLQQQGEEPVITSDPAVVSKAETEQIKTGDDGDPSETLISAGLVAMFGLPAIVPPPTPVQAQPTESVISDTAEVGSKDTSTGSSQASAPTFAQPGVESSAAPFPTTPQKTTPSTLRKGAALPESKDAPLPEPVAPVLQVATVRGIIPPVQNATPIPAEATPKSAPAPIPASQPAASIEIPVETQGVPAQRGSEPAISATTPETVPATFTGKVTQPITAENKTFLPETPAAGPIAATVQISGKVAVISRTEIFSGMAAAQPGRAMSAPTILRSQSSTPATPAEVSANGAASVVPSLGESPSLRHAPVLASENGRERSANERSENPENPLVPTPEFLPTTFSSQSTPPNTISASTARIQPADVAQVVNHTLAAAERLRASGQEHVDIALKLEGGQELTIQLRVANGQVTPIIRTESESLRLALEQNWSQFFQRSGERELQVTKPVFESPQTSSNMTDLNQQRDGHQRAFQEPPGSFAQQYLPRRATTPGASQPISIISTPRTGVRLYA